MSSSCTRWPIGRTLCVCNYAIRFCHALCELLRWCRGLILQVPYQSNFDEVFTSLAMSMCLWAHFWETVSIHSKNMPNNKIQRPGRPSLKHRYPSHPPVTIDLRFCSLVGFYKRRGSRSAPISLEPSAPLGGFFSSPSPPISKKPAANMTQTCSQKRFKTQTMSFTVVCPLFALPTTTSASEFHQYSLHSNCSLLQSNFIVRMLFKDVFWLTNLISLNLLFSFLLLLHVTYERLSCLTN